VSEIGHTRKLHLGVFTTATGNHASGWPGFFPVVGGTEREVQEKYQILRSYIRPGSALVVMSQRLGHDM
jgi:hypothetical protein